MSAGPRVTTAATATVQCGAAGKQRVVQAVTSATAAGDVAVGSGGDG